MALMQRLDFTDARSAYEQSEHITSRFSASLQRLLARVAEDEQSRYVYIRAASRRSMPPAILTLPPELEMLSRSSLAEGSCRRGAAGAALKMRRASHEWAELDYI